MVQKYFVLVGALVFLAGCASTQQGQSVADMQLRISDLERQVEAKDEEIKELKYSVKDMSYEMDRIKTQSQRGSSARTSDSKSASYVKNDEILRVNVNPEKVQQALKGAGYYTGTIDGKLGARTKGAISKFQQDHGLKADGVVGEKTWNALKSYAGE